MTLDRSTFVTSIAHRGLHDGKGLLENTAPAFEAGLEGGFGLECDLQPAADGTPLSIATNSRSLGTGNRATTSSPRSASTWPASQLATASA
ncbi:MAG TPA: hypothetical protein PK970_02045, partial [Hyphomicrobiaceae bacterium]|nr:hypothetical protein [Hyphomicrobiaceae bacterium]